MKIDLKGKRVLVTGGSSGIGSAIVQALAGAGAKVALTYRTHPKSAESLVRAIKENRGKAMAIESDVSNPASVVALFQRMDETWGGIDILINNAGMDGERALGWAVDFPAWKK